MTMQINIHQEGIELTPAITAYAEERIGGLTKFMDSLLTADIWLGKTSNHHQKGDIYECKVNLSYPGDGILRAEATNEDLYNAISEAHDILREQISQYKGKKKEFDRGDEVPAEDAPLE